MIKEKTFNKWFNIFIITAMLASMAAMTFVKLKSSDSGHALLLLSTLGSLMGVLASVASANARIITFLFGLLDVSIYGGICLVNWHNGSSGLGNGLLHFLYFVPMQFIGFFQWRKLGATATKQVKARRLSRRQWIVLSVTSVLALVLSYYILERFDKSNAASGIVWTVVWDALPLICNIVGQILMSLSYMEQWIFWIGVNIFSIIMWSNTLRTSPDSSYAPIYILKYAFYLLNSINGLRIWIGLSRRGKQI